MSNNTRAARKKYGAIVSEPQDSPTLASTPTPTPVPNLELYLLAKGYPHSLWYLHTIRQGEFIPLLPVFSSEINALQFLSNFPESGMRVVCQPLVDLSLLINENQLLFSLDLTIKNYSAEPMLQEGNNWAISLADLNGRLLSHSNLNEMEIVD